MKYSSKITLGNKINLYELCLEHLKLMDKLYKLTGQYGNVPRIKFVRDVSGTDLRTAKNYLVINNLWIGSFSKEEKKNAKNEFDRALFVEITGRSPEEWLKINIREGYTIAECYTKLYYLATSIIAEWQ